MSVGARFQEMHRDGTYKSGYQGRLELVGFWLINEEGDLEFHVVTSLAFFGDEFDDDLEDDDWNEDDYDVEVIYKP